MTSSNYKGDDIFRSRPHQHQQPSQNQQLSPSISGSIGHSLSNASTSSVPAKSLRSNLRRNNFHNVQHHSQQQQQQHERRQPAPTGTERMSLTSSIRNHLLGSYCSSDTTVVNNSSSFPTCGIGGQPPGLCRPTLSMVSESSVVADKTSTHRPHPQHFSSNGCTPSSSGVDAVRGFVKGFISPFVACIQPDHYQYQQQQQQQPQLNPSAAVKRSTTGVSIQHASSFGSYVSHVEAKRADTATSNANGSEKENIIEPNINDVLCGRGNNHNRHPGNVHFRELIAANKLLYCTLTKKEKMLVARQIVNIILHSTDPPGRFLGRDGNTGMWYDIGLPRSLEKTSQALREKVVPTSATAGTSTPALENSSSKCDKNNDDGVTDLDDDDVVDRGDEKTVVAENVSSKERQRDLEMSATKLENSTTGIIKKTRTPNPHITIPNHLQSIYHSQQRQKILQQQQHQQMHQHTSMSRMYPYPNNYMSHVVPSSSALPPLLPRQPHYHAASFSATPPPPPPPPVHGQTGHHHHYRIHPNHSYTPYQQHPTTPSHTTNTQNFYYHRQPDGSTAKKAPPIHPLSQGGIYNHAITENSAPPKQDDYRITTNLYYYPAHDSRSPYKSDGYHAQPVNTPSSSGSKTSGAPQDAPIVTPGNGESSSRDKVDYQNDKANQDVNRVELNQKNAGRCDAPISISRESSPIQQKHWKRQRTIVNGNDQEQVKSNDSNDRDYNNDTDLPGSRIGSPTPSFSDYHKNYNITSEPTQLVQAIETHLSLEDRVVGSNRKQQEQHLSPSSRAVTITMTSTVDEGDDDDDDRRKENDQYPASVLMLDEKNANKVLFKDLSSPTGLTQGRLRTRLYSSTVAVSGSFTDNDGQEHKYPIGSINYSTSNGSSNAFAGNEMDGLAALSTAAFLLQLDESSNS